jgi:hypothetical protein
MIPFCLGIACGAVLIAVVVAVGTHVAMELADGSRASF